MSIDTRLLDCGSQAEIEANFNRALIISDGVGGRVTTLENLNNIVGVKFLKASTSPSGARTHGAVGKTAVAGVGAAGSSDFDTVPVFRLRLCNRAAGAVTAYYGEPGFDPTSDTFVEMPKGYYRVFDDGESYNYVIADFQFTGSALHPAFKHNSSEQDYCYIAAYKSSYDGVSKHESKSGALPDVGVSRTTSRTRSRARGAFASLQDIQARDWLNLLFMVEFASRDSQTMLGRGYCDMPYSVSHTATLSETGVNRVVLANAYADLFVVGQEISIGTATGNISVAADRTVTSIDAVDGSSKALAFDGDPVTTAVGNVVWTSRQKNGKTDTIAQGSGRATGVNGKTAIRYRGIESPFGNVWEWVDNLNIRNNQGYSLVTGALSGYNDTDFGTEYSALSGVFPASNNYMTTPLIDPVSGLSCFPSAVGGGSSQYFCDYYYQSAGDRAAYVGGNWYNGSFDGLWYWYLYYAASDTNVVIGARLLEIPA